MALICDKCESKEGVRGTEITIDADGEHVLKKTWKKDLCSKCRREIFQGMDRVITGSVNVVP